MSGVWVPVLASMKGFIAEVNRGADQAVSSAGSKLKKGLSDATKDGGADAAAKMARAVEAQTQKISTARKAQAQAAADAEVAEQKLKTMMESGTASASQIARAEEAVATAKRKHETASNQVARGERDLEAVRQGGSATASSLARAEDALANAKDKAATKQGALRTTELQLDEARANAKTAADNVANAELNLINTRDRYGANTRETANAEKQLETAKRQAASADDQVATAAGRVTKARAEVANATDNVRAKSMSHKAAQDEVSRSERRAGDEASSAGKKIRGMGGDMDAANPKAKNLTGSLMGVAGKAGVAAGAFLGVQGVTSVLGAGFDRLQNIERAEIGFKNIGLTADETKAQMAKLSDQVTGTSVSLSDAAKYSAMFAQSGVKMGQPMDDTIQAFTNLSAAASGTGVDVGNVMTQISAAGRLMGGDAMQLQQAGINIYQYVADYMGKSVEEVKKLGEEGKISFEDVIGAVNKGTGNLAKDMGETMSAKMANMKTALASLGAAIIEPLMGPMTTAVTGLTNLLKGLIGPLKAVGSWAKEHKPIIYGVAAAFAYFGSVLAAAAFVEKVKNIESFGGALMNMAKGTKIATAAQWAFNTAANANPMIWIATAIAAVVAGLVLFFTKTETGRKMWAAFTGFLKDAWDATVQAVKAGYESYIKPVWDGLVSGAQMVWDKLQTFFGWIKDAFSGLKSLFVDGDFTGALSQAFGLDEDSPIVDHFLTIRDTVMTVFNFIKEKFLDLGTAFGQFRDTWLVPIGNAVQGIVNTVIIPAFNLLGSVGDWVFKNVLGPAMSFFGSVIQLVWQSVIMPTFEAIKAGVNLVGQIIGIIVNTVIVPAWNFLGTMIKSVWDNIINPVWDFIKNAVGVLADILTGNFDNIGNRFSGMGQAISDIVHGVIKVAMDYFKGLVEMVGNAWQGFKQVVGAVVNFVKDRIADMIHNLGSIPGKIAGIFSDAGQWLINAGYSIISGLWEGMKSAWEGVKNWLSDHLSFSAIGSLVGLAAGGVVESNADGSVSAYAAGGIRRLERYANGGGRENHRAMIAPAGAWRVWAEPETGGEAYIPLASSKRQRSTAILDNVAQRFGYTLVDQFGQPYKDRYSGDLGPQNVQHFANGAVRSSEDLDRFVKGGFGAPRPLEGTPYVWGGGLTANWGDCSGAMSGIAAFATGVPIQGRKFATSNEASWLSSHGFIRGRGGPGDLRIGFKNGGPAGGHTAGTLPNNVNVEMGGARGNGQYGGGAAGAWDSYFNEFFYLPVGPAFAKPEIGGLGDLGGKPGMPGVTAGTLTAPDMSGGYMDTTGTGAGRSGSSGSSSQPQSISDMAGTVAKEAVSGQVKDILGVFGIPDTLPSWVVGGQQLAAEARKPQGSANAASTSVAEDHAADIHDEAVTTMTPSQLASTPQISAAPTFDVAKPKPLPPQWGPEFFAYEIARQAKAMNLGPDGAKIGVATALVESGDPMKMYANNQVPESLKYRHDAVGSDYDSVGLFQQRNNGAWGTVADRMDPFRSAGMFFRELAKFDWRAMEAGAAAQRVQRSAFPGRYSGKMGRAQAMVRSTGLFDTGGVLPHEGMAVNLSGKPEAILTGDQWKLLASLGDQLPTLVGQATTAGISTAGMAGVNAIAPGMGTMAMPAVNAVAGYAGAVTSGWTSALMTAARQTADAVTEPFTSEMGNITAPIGQAIHGVMANSAVPESPEVANQARNGGPAPVVINVQNVDQAIEAKKHLEARALAGFM